MSEFLKQFLSWRGGEEEGGAAAAMAAGAATTSSLDTTGEDKKNKHGRWVGWID